MDKEELSKTWLKLNKISWEIKKMLIGETNADILELKKARDVIDKVSEIIKKKLES